MNDPSERFGERLDCGCEFAQGTWFYCPEHQPPPPCDECGEDELAWRCPVCRRCVVCCDCHVVEATQATDQEPQ